MILGSNGAIKLPPESKCAEDSKDKSVDIFTMYHSNRSYSNSPAGSYGSSLTSKDSCGHSRQISKGSIKSKTPRSGMSTPVVTSQEVLFSNMDEFGKCNHRLKLHFDINVFAKLDEDFLCQMRVGLYSDNI